MRERSFVVVGRGSAVEPFPRSCDDYSGSIGLYAITAQIIGCPVGGPFIDNGIDNRAELTRAVDLHLIQACSVFRHRATRFAHADIAPVSSGSECDIFLAPLSFADRCDLRPVVAVGRHFYAESCGVGILPEQSDARKLKLVLQINGNPLVVFLPFAFPAFAGSEAVGYSRRIVAP